MPVGNITDDVRFKVAQSIVIVETHRHSLTSELQRRLAEMETEEEAFGQGEVAAFMLVDLLMEAARQIAARGHPGRLDVVAREHRRLEIGSIHYFRFGAALEPALRTIVGSALPTRIASAWIDAFRFVIAQLALFDTRIAMPACPAPATPARDRLVLKPWRQSGL